MVISITFADDTEPTWKLLGNYMQDFQCFLLDTYWFDTGWVPMMSFYWEDEDEEMEIQGNLLWLTVDERRGRIERIGRIG